MLYGILLESCRDGISATFGRQTWKRIIQELNLGHETFTILGRYEENLIERIAECLSNILRENSPDSCMEFFGQCFVRFFTTYGYDKILRVAGRHFRDFLHAIDQLHDSNRFSFPEMKSPLFSVAEEDEQGVILMYKSRRRGFQHYVVGQLRECAMDFYNETIEVIVHEDLSTDEYTRIMFRVNFNNEIIKQCNLRMMKPLRLPDIKSSTFFQVFPFCIMFDPEMRISHIGPRLQSLFNENISVIGKHISDVFTVLRPDILHIEWAKFLNYGKSVIFVMESCIPLKNETNKIMAQKQDVNSNKTSSIRSTSIKLKGQMKYIPSWHRLAFLCHPMLTTTEEMLSIGLFLNDLNFYDGSSKILISGLQHARQLQKAIEKQHACVNKLQCSKNELQDCRKRAKRLLYSMMPRHIVQLLQQGILPNSICESYKLLTTLFAHLIDIQEMIRQLTPQQIIDSINQMIEVFDTCAEKFDVHQIERHADSTYMIVAGIHNRSLHNNRRGSNISINTNDSSSSAGDEYNDWSYRLSTEHNYAMEAEHNTRNDFYLMRPHAKNPYDLNQAEIISLVALELMEASQSVINPLTKQPFRIKFGFHSGSAVGGIIGNRRYQYCLFGDSISTASRVAICGQIGKINFSVSSYELLKDSPYFETAYRGNIEMKGAGFMHTYWLVGRTQTYLSLLEIGHRYTNTINHHPIANMAPQKTSEIATLDHGDLKAITDNQLLCPYPLP